MAVNEPITYDRAELRSILKAFKALDDEAVDEAKSASNALAQFAADRIKQSAYGRFVAAEAVRTHHFGKRVALMRRGHVAAPAPAHFGQAHLDPALGKLPRRFASGEPAADDMDLMIRHRPRRYQKSVAMHRQKRHALQHELSLHHFR